MAADVLVGGTRSERAVQWLSLLFFLPVTVGLAAIPYPMFYVEEEDIGVLGYELGTWYVRAAFVVVALFALRYGLRVRKPIVAPVLEIDRDAIRLTSRRYNRTIARAAVRSTYLGPEYLHFESALGDRIKGFGIVVFGQREVDHALRRHGWNVTSRQR